MSRADAVLGAATVCAGGVVARDRSARWGATDADVLDELPGEEFVFHADHTVICAVPVHAPPDAFWLRIARLGRGRGGVYSYDGPENRLGPDVDSTERIVLEWRSPGVGPQVRLAVEVPLTVAVAGPGPGAGVAGIRRDGPRAGALRLHLGLRRARCTGRHLHPSRGPRELRLPAVVGPGRRGAGGVRRLRDGPAMRHGIRQRAERS